MAKQVGLFALRGKIENKSFYKTAGVPDTVIRNIPEGLSTRVKTADEYANTRLNNSEFKNANGISAFLFNAVPNRKASMMRRFAIAEMTKKSLEFIKEGSGAWGNRIPSATFDQIAQELLENHAKSGAYQGEFGVVTVDPGDGSSIDVSIAYDDITASALIEKGINGFYALMVKGALAEVVDADGFVRQHFGVSSISPSNLTVDPAGGDHSFAAIIPGPDTLGMSPAGYVAAQGAANNGMYAILSFIPYRQIGAKRHSLYEYATYTCVSLGQIPTE